MFTHPQKKGGRKERRKESWMRDNRSALFTIYINMLTVSSDVSIQRRHWQPLSVHFLWGYCAHPTHDVNDVWGWPCHRGLRPLLFLNSGLGFWTDKCKRCEMGPKVFHPYPRRLLRNSNHLQMSSQRQHFLLSHLKTLSVGPVVVQTRNPFLSRPGLSQLN